ncbi:hypothetical protein K0B96_11790 [Horticoccus luteus]|uniref:Uncharacterized protein n=1 Tax=Horticoccus luteus TaxID=2862869 RepID=A0A8F9TTZ3_9BACT|nr:hypothetical protein [Horticoccus luteus]QYM77991.1 hypothetical protein K0B96_11790 [Horticoccus luteus]
MDEIEDENPPAPPPSSLSKTPSWITLGFVLGAAFMWFLPPREIVKEPPAPPPAPVVRPPPADIALIEAVFDEWGKYASWDNDRTEVALWEPTTRSYAHCFEVRRVAGDVYFRSIPALTQPLLTHGVPPGSPLAFTETEASRREWLKESTDESWRALSEAARQSMQGSGGARKP